MELKKIKCPSCGGELEMPKDSDEMKCSYCGSKVIIDDKATEVGRIKKAEIKAKKELDEHELENKKKNDEYNDERENKKQKNTGKLKGWAIALTVICLLFSILAFKDGKILSGFIGLIQVAAFGYVTLLCFDVLPEKFTNLHKIIFIGGCVLIIPFFSLGNVKIGGSSNEKSEDLIWNDYVISSKLPEPKTLKGRLITDSSSLLYLYIMGVDRTEFKEYVSACKNKGYTIDVMNSSDLYMASNEEGYLLSLSFNETDKEYSINLMEPPKKETATEQPQENTTTAEPVKPEEEPNTPESIVEETPKSKTNNNLSPDFKKAMDDYESFMDEYISFMKKYSSNPTDLSLLKDLSNYEIK